MKINSLDTENTSNATIYKLSQTYIFPNSDPILQKGFYTENFLKSILKESFEFALKCTNFKDFITEVSLEEAKKTRQIETPEDKVEIETPEDNLAVETKEISSNKKIEINNVFSIFSTNKIHTSV